MNFFEPTRPELRQSIGQLCLSVNEKVARLIAVETTLGEEAGLIMSLQVLSSAVAEVLKQLDTLDDSEGAGEAAPE